MIQFYEIHIKWHFLKPSLLIVERMTISLRFLFLIFLWFSGIQSNDRPIIYKLKNIYKPLSKKFTQINYTQIFSLQKPYFAVYENFR